ncbi:MAG: Uncharacterised protein [Marine Group II euryarchaeote MED-G33]|nr:MAG: Uncharacterised protein [Marine Group II euryarchaeote MED-G33]
MLLRQQSMAHQAITSSLVPMKFEPLRNPSAFFGFGPYPTNRRRSLDPLQVQPRMTNQLQIIVHGLSLLFHHDNGRLPRGLIGPSVDVERNSSKHLLGLLLKFQMRPLGFQLGVGVIRVGLEVLHLLDRFPKHLTSKRGPPPNALSSRIVQP